MKALVWFRRDLRLHDNAALKAAQRATCCIPLYIDDSSIKSYPIGGAARWWLHHSLRALQISLQAKGSDLLIQKGDSLKLLEQLIAKYNITHLFWNRLYNPEEIARDTLIKKKFIEKGITVHSFAGNVIKEPWDITNKQNLPYKVFTAFFRAFRAETLLNALPILKAPRTLPPCPVKISNKQLKSLELLPTHPNWANAFAETWTPGEAHAQQALKKFIKNSLQNYSTTRNIPSKIEGTSKLSPHLHWGELSIRATWQAIQDIDKNGTFLNELGWREFAQHLLYYFPQLPFEPLQKKFLSFPWKKNNQYLKAWQQGLTGYPIVDAGMRQLWSIGWMPNRVRMIVGSFFVKDLNLPWVEGADWFWDTLVDADLGSNYMNWQWVTGCGVDAAPFFRIFNPITQGTKFDPEGIYVKTWVPELQNMPKKYIHNPWQAPKEILVTAEITLGKDYPLPMVDHSRAREFALQAFKNLGK